MSKNDWYLGEKWDRETEEFFEIKLKRVRDPFNKAQYLRIKGNCLIKSKDISKRVVGVKLLERVVSDFLEEETESYSACEILGDFYKKNNEYELSESYYRKVVDYYEKSRSGTSGIADIKLAELIVDGSLKDKYDEMYLLLTEIFESTNGRLLFNDDRYRYALVLCKLTNSKGIDSEAIYYANKALELSKEAKPQLDKKPVGIVNSKKEDVFFLETIIEKNTDLFI